MVNTEEDIKQILQQYRDCKVYVAVSGGVDSLLLLHLFQKYAISVQAIHINYHLRGSESNEDEAFVRSFCSTRNIPLQIREIDLKQKLNEGGNTQEKAREYRYNWFHEIIAADPKNRVALAHHLDDQIETFYLNLARKSGVMGLACMLPENKGIIRPFLKMKKASILELAKNEKLQWREDSSNKKSTYNRNKLRNEILPSLYADIPTLARSIAILTDRFQELQQSLEERTSALVVTINQTGKLSNQDFQQLSELEQVELFRSLELSVKVLSELKRLTTKGTFLPLINHQFFTKIVKEADGYSFIGSKSSQVPTLQITPCETLPKSFSLDKLFLDTEDVRGELSIRKWSIGDRIAPVGMKGTTLISDILSDAKMTFEEKQNTYVLLDDDIILWCVGHKVSRYAVSKSNSGNYLCIELIY